MSKRFFLAGMAIWHCLSSEAQTDFHFADTSAMWYQSRALYSASPEGLLVAYSANVFRVGTDTVFDNLEYQKITRYTSSGNSTYYYSNIPGNNFFIRKDSTGKIFCCNLGSRNVIYDFGLNKNDTLKSTNPVNGDDIWYVVDSTDLKMRYGALRKIMYVRYISTGYCYWPVLNDVFVEGVGSLNSHFLYPNVMDCISNPGDKHTTLCFEEKGIIYPVGFSPCIVGMEEVSSQEIEMYPNPANDYVILTGITEPTNLQLYDCLGKEVLSKKLKPGENRIEVNNLTGGIYTYKLTDRPAVGKLLILE